MATRRWMGRAMGALGLALILTLGLAPAQADDVGCSCGHARGAYGGRFRSRSSYAGGSYARGRYGGGACGPYRGRAFGGSWSTLRRYLTPTGSALRYFYVRNYFLRRYPHLFARGEPPRGQVIEREHFVHPAYDVATTPRTPLQRLNYGMWQLHLGDYAAARTSFQGVAPDASVHPQAAYGALMSALATSDWDAAADDLGHLARIDALRANAQLDVEGLFGEKGKFENIMGTLREHVRWQFHDGAAQLAGGWLYAVQGNTRMAKVYLAKAARQLDNHPAVRALQQGLATPKPKSAPTPAKPTAPDKPERPVGEGPVVRAPDAPGAVVADIGPHALKTRPAKAVDPASPR